MVHSIFDTWHYEVLWTYTLPRLLWYACDSVCMVLYITLHIVYIMHCMTRLKASCQMHFNVCFQPAQQYIPNCSWWNTAGLLDLQLQVGYDGIRKHTSRTLPSSHLSMFWSTLRSILSRTVPVALHCTLHACLTFCSQVSSQDALECTPKNALKYTSNWT